MVIGVEQIPGQVTYDYHSHTDTNGGVSHSDKQFQYGGCYTTPICHIHTGDYRNGGGCYSIPINHNHAENCYIKTRFERVVISYWFTGQGTGHGCCDNSHGQNYAKYRYKDNTYRDGVLVSSVEREGDLGYCCGLCIDKTAADKRQDSTTTTIKCGHSEGLNGYDLGCDKTTESIEAYTPGCGFSDRQITGAHILYDANSIGPKMQTPLVQEDKSKEENLEIQSEIELNEDIVETEYSLKEILIIE